MKLYVMEKIADRPPEERPREKIIDKGVSSLSDSELLSVLIGSGTKDTGVEKITAAVLDMIDKQNGLITPEKLTSIKGIGTAKATLILAALEFSRRRLCPDRIRIGFPKDILPLITHYADRKQEHFLCISLNGAHEVISVRVVSVGLVNRALVHPREVYADPLSDRAAAVILAHNHPSGNLEPSTEDRTVTKKLQGAADILGINFLDHIIFGRTGYYSFLEKGEL
jgi:DNA repair protein RadC